MVTNELKEYIQKRDVEKVRKELLAILNTNPDMGDGQFEENLNYAIRILGENAIYTPYSGVFEMKNSKEEWTTSYVAKIYLQLRKEFSKELIIHLKDVAPIAYSEKVAQRDLSQQTIQKTRKLSEKNEKSNFWGICVIVVKWVMIVVIIGGLIALGINVF